MTDRVVMRLRGRMLERFVGRAVQEGVRFQAVERIGAREMRLTASAGDAARLMRLAEEYRMDLTVADVQGRPYWRRRMKERGTLTLGLMLGVMLVTAFTSRIWQVEAVSLDGMAAAETLSAIEESAAEWGARPGSLRSVLDRDALAMNIQAQWPELTHVSVRLSGVKLRVEVAMEETAPDVYDVSMSRDLVAARDAVIVQVEPLAGQAAVQPGDTVRRGQVLIRGEERIDAELTRGIRALGEVTARVWFSASCELPLSRTVRERTGLSRVSAEIRLGGWNWPLSQAKDFACQEVEEEYLPIGGMYLPVRIVRTVRWEAAERLVPYDLQALRAQGEAWALELARAQVPESASETEYWADFLEKDGKLVVQVTVEAQMNIAVDRSQLTGDSDR